MFIIVGLYLPFLASEEAVGAHFWFPAAISSEFVSLCFVCFALAYGPRRLSDHASKVRVFHVPSLIPLPQSMTLNFA